MRKYIDADKLIAEIMALKEKYGSCVAKNEVEQCYKGGRLIGYEDALNKINKLQQEQPIEGKQIIIITETDGDANIHWDCRSLDDVMALLTSAKSFIADKQIEELRGKGSGPDHNTVEGRFRNAHKFQQEQPEVDEDFFFDEVLKVYDDNNKYPPRSEEELTMLETIARHFWNKGYSARKEESK